MLAEKEVEMWLEGREQSWLPANDESEKGLGGRAQASRNERHGDINRVVFLEIKIRKMSR